MSIKNRIARAFRIFLTILSPKINTRVLYRVKFKKKLELSRPKTLNEKVLWLKFNTYWNNSIIKQCADKYLVRSYLEERGFGYILNELIGVYSDVDNIPWDELPNKFAIKLNVGCGKNIIVTDKNRLNIKDISKVLKRWLKSQYWMEYSEMQYKDVKPLILVEKYLGKSNGELPRDYKFYCMNGASKFVMMCENRVIGKKAQYYYYDQLWNLMPYTQDALDNPNHIITKPDGMEEAFKVASQLAKDFPFVRVDLYIIDGKIYFGELTFTPSAGLDNGRLSSTDIMLGESLKLPCE